MTLRKVFVSRVNAAQVLAGNIEKTGCARSDAQEYGVIALLEQAFHLNLSSHDGVKLQIDAQGFHVLDLRLDDVFREPKLRDAVDQDAAAIVQGLEDGNFVAHSGQICGNM